MAGCTETRAKGFPDTLMLQVRTVRYFWPCGTSDGPAQIVSCRHRTPSPARYGAFATTNVQTSQPLDLSGVPAPIRADLGQIGSLF
jgi:hypothetical protein